MTTLFVLVISGTDTIEHPGISAAGADLAALKYTAALDAEFIATGKTLTQAQLPVSPSGIVSPALISKAGLNILKLDCQIFNAGSHVPPQIPCHDIHLTPGRTIDNGNTMDTQTVEKIFIQGKLTAKELIKKYDQLIIAECVVGGTTTALGLITALGYNAQQMISSSFPNGNHEIKNRIIQEGLKHSPRLDLIEANPLLAVAAMGDPSQAFIAGLAISHPNCVLAGGTQMLAIQTLIDKLGQSKSKIITTEWVYHDSSAQFQKLHGLVCPETKVDYSQMTKFSTRNNTYQQLNNEILKLSSDKLDLESITSKYAQGHVKEGVGMGALLYSLGFKGG